MGALVDIELALLDFLCAVHDMPGCRVVAVKASRKAALRRLRYAGLVGMEDFTPSPWAQQDWRSRQDNQIASNPGEDPVETPAHQPSKEPTEPPEPEAVDDRGSADARIAEALPLKVTGANLAAELSAWISEHGLSKARVGRRILNCDSGVEVLRKSKEPRPETIARVRSLLASAPAEDLRLRRSVAGDGLSQQIRAGLARKRSGDQVKQNTRGASGAYGRGRERAPEGGLANGPIPEERRTPDTAAPTIPERNTRGESGTAREASGAEESSTAMRILDRSPFEEPASPPDVAPARQARPARPKPPRRDPTLPPETPLTDLRERQSQNGYRHAAAVRRGQEEEAAKLVDQGIDPSAVTSSLTANLMRAVIRRREEDARLADPIEQAKTILRRRFSPVVNAEIMDGPKGKFVVGRKVVDRNELLAMAKALAA